MLGLHEVARELGGAAEVAAEMTAVFLFCTEDGTGEGDSALPPSLALAYFRDAWTRHAVSIHDDLDAASAIMSGWANQLSKLDDSVQSSLE